MLARDPSAAGRDWSALKCIGIAGSPSAEAMLRQARSVFGDVIYQVYGQSEVFPVTMIGPRELFAEIPGSQPIRSAGRVFPFAELAILDVESHKPLAVGEEGEIAAKTDGQMSGFWNDPEATAAKIHEGWVLTGDIGKLDEHGYLYVLDRVADMIISGGFNIWPAELENVIASHPAIIEVAVFGVPDERWGETPIAVCVVAEGERVDEEEIIELCKERLGSYKKPSQVIVTADPLPRSPVGKVLRRSLRDPYWKGRERAVAG
jgi:acyl-CoA synthetase (AMP-forming)/AMP-acid ligase II